MMITRKDAVVVLELSQGELDRAYWTLAELLGDRGYASTSWDASWADLRQLTPFASAKVRAGNEELERHADERAAAYYRARTRRAEGGDPR